jgi:hypothetical protein
VTDSALQQFRSIVLADPALQDELAAFEDPASFAAAARGIARRRGLILTDGELAPALRPDPLGIARFDAVAPTPDWAPPGWLPVDIVETESGPAVDWAHFGGAALTESFFAQSARRAIARPFNRMFRWQTPVADFLRVAAPAPLPQGLIFHWSRCGSTLVSRVLARLPGAAAISEAAPIDIALRLGDPRLLRAMAAALARGHSRSFLKLHCWHALAMPVFRAAFPQAPWLFLHREPVEILVSHAAMPSPEMSPQFMPPQTYGLDPQAAGEADYVARVLARIGQAAIDAALGGRGLFVDYRRLPGAVTETILPHFGVPLGPEEAGLLASAAAADAKRPDRPFRPDSATKRGAATPEQEAAAGRHLAALHRQFEAMA